MSEEDKGYHTVVYDIVHISVHYTAAYISMLWSNIERSGHSTLFASDSAKFCIMHEQSVVHEPACAVGSGFKGQALVVLCACVSGSVKMVS